MFSRSAGTFGPLTMEWFGITLPLMQIPSFAIDIREIHIVRNGSGEPASVLCTECGWQFALTSPAEDIWGRVDDLLRRKFEEHKCIRHGDQAARSSRPA
jgi:hypothetical protein